MTLLTYAQAVDLIREEAGALRLAPEMIDLSAIPGRFCAVDVRSPMANQPFDNSAMDGYALRAADAGQPLMILGRITAGDPPPAQPLASGSCVEIMTGAPMPPGCDTVVPVERTEVKEGRLIIRAPVQVGDFIRRAGDDFAAGDIVLRAGLQLDAAHILPLSTLGVARIPVMRRPKIGVISTGREIVDDMAQPLAPGQIYNGSGPYLHAVLPLHYDADCIACGTVSDDPGAYKEVLHRAVAEGCDIIISTGAVSAGIHDFIPSVLKDSGANIVFHQVAIRPGRPVLFARLGNKGPFFFGLPGNPVSTAAGLRLFVYPLLRALRGQAPETPRGATLSADYIKGDIPLRFFLRARLAGGKVEALRKQQSFMVSAFLDTNCWLICPEDKTELKAGSHVEIYSLHPDKMEPVMTTFSRPVLEGLSVAYVILSDRASSGAYKDRTGPVLRAFLEGQGAKIIDAALLPDDRKTIAKHLRSVMKKHKPVLLITAGGTGLSPRDVAPECIAALSDRLIPGFGELLRQDGSRKTPFSWLSRSVAGIAGQTLLLALPGSPKAVEEGMETLLPLLPHAIATMRGGTHD